MEGALVSDFDDMLSAEIEGLPDEELLTDIKELISYAASQAPRSLQKALGPSQVGHPCPRRLALGMRGVRGHNTGGDPLASIVGRAVHTWLEGAIAIANERLGRERWLSEAKVSVTDGLDGTCDLYDRDTKSVLDWKCPGASRFKKYTTYGPSPAYRGQVHMYGRGYIRKGLEVEKVGIVWIPRAGTLRQTKLWREPYNPALVDEILARRTNTIKLCEGMDVDRHPERYRLIPIVPDDDCAATCNYWTPGVPENPFQCDGKH
jgi:hypothetical protein